MPPLEAEEGHGNPIILRVKGKGLGLPSVRRQIGLSPNRPPSATANPRQDGFAHHAVGTQRSFSTARPMIPGAVVCRCL